MWPAPLTFTMEKPLAVRTVPASVPLTVQVFSGAALKSDALPQGRASIHLSLPSLDSNDALFSILLSRSCGLQLVRLSEHVIRQRPQGVRHSQESCYSEFGRTTRFTEEILLGLTNCR
jgi:hypothetical protein